MRIHKITGGYMGVMLSKNREHRAHLVHRLVATAFIDNPNNFPQINHKDENPINNRVDNLEWCNSLYNNNYGHHRERLSKLHLNKRKNQRGVIFIDTNEHYFNCYDASRKTGIYVSGIRKACDGEYAHAGGYRWKYEDAEKHNNKVSLKALEKFNNLINEDNYKEGD